MDRERRGAPRPGRPSQSVARQNPDNDKRTTDLLLEQAFWAEATRRRSLIIALRDEWIERIQGAA